MEAHYRACLYAGVNICGTNAEVMPAQVRQGSWDGNLDNIIVLKYWLLMYFKLGMIFIYGTLSNYRITCIMWSSVLPPISYKFLCNLSVIPLSSVDQRIVSSCRGIYFYL